MRLAAPLAVVLALLVSGGARAATITEFSEGIAGGGTAPFGITAGPDANLWFTELNGSRIARITATGVVTEFPLGANRLPYRIASGPDGNLWFTESGSNAIGVATPAGAVTGEFAIVPTLDAGPAGITAGPDGNMWFTEYGANKVARITPTGTVTEFTLPSGASQPFEIVSGPDGYLWFTEYGGNRIARQDPAGGINEFPLPTAGSAPYGIAVGPDGNVWFTEYDGNRIGRITPAGVITEFSAGLSPGAGPQGIATGPDGNLWFAEQRGNRIGRITPAGVITEFPIPSANPGPSAIVAGPDGALWFTESSGHRIGHITTDDPPLTSGNLLRNPGFETGVPAGSTVETAPIVGWVTTPNFIAVPYGVHPDLPSPAVATQIGGGANFAVGGPTNAQSRAVQDVDVAGHAEAIDAGRATATVGALLGGKTSDPDTGTVTATFLSATRASAGTLTLGPVTAADRSNQSTLLPRSLAAVVPQGTRVIRIVAEATRPPGTIFNDAAFDNLSLILDIAPAPAPGGPPSGGTGPAGAPTPDVTPPVIDQLAADPARFAVGPRPTALTAAKRRPTPRGTSLRYRLSEPATVTLAFRRVTTGRRAGGRCVKVTGANRGARACRRYVDVGALERKATQGVNATRFTGRIGTRALRAGRYLLTATAVDTSGNRAQTPAISLRVVGR